MASKSKTGKAQSNGTMKTKWEKHFGGIQDRLYKAMATLEAVVGEYETAVDAFRESINSTEAVTQAKRLAHVDAKVVAMKDWVECDGNSLELDLGDLVSFTHPDAVLGDLRG